MFCKSFVKRKINQEGQHWVDSRFEASLGYMDPVLKRGTSHSFYTGIHVCKERNAKSFIAEVLVPPSHPVCVGMYKYVRVLLLF